MLAQRGDRARRGEAADPARSVVGTGRRHRRLCLCRSGKGCSRISASATSSCQPTRSPRRPARPRQSDAVLTTAAGGVAPIFVGAWGAIDLIRDPYSDAASGGLRLTALATMDVTYSRGEQIAVLTGVR